MFTQDFFIFPKRNYINNYGDEYLKSNLQVPISTDVMLRILLVCKYSHDGLPLHNSCYSTCDICNVLLPREENLQYFCRQWSWKPQWISAQWQPCVLFPHNNGLLSRSTLYLQGEYGDYQQCHQYCNAWEHIYNS